MQIAGPSSLVMRLIAGVAPGPGLSAVAVRDLLDPMTLLARALRVQAEAGGAGRDALLTVADSMAPADGSRFVPALVASRIEAAVRQVLAADLRLAVLDRLIEVVGSRDPAGAVSESDLATVDQIVRRILEGGGDEPLEARLQRAVLDLLPSDQEVLRRAALVHERTLLQSNPTLHLLRAAEAAIAPQETAPSQIAITLAPVAGSPTLEARVEIDPEDRRQTGASGGPAAAAVLRIALPKLGATEVHLALAGHDLRLDVRVGAAERVEALVAEIPLLEAWLAEAGLAALTRVRTLPPERRAGREQALWA